MTKKEAMQDFLENILPEIKKLEKNGIDKTMRAEEWNNYTDALCKGGRITSKQYHNWSNPF